MFAYIFDLQLLAQNLTYNCSLEFAPTIVVTNLTYNMLKLKWANNLT